MRRPWSQSSTEKSFAHQSPFRRGHREALLLIRFADRLEAIATRVEAIATRVEAIATRVEATAPSLSPVVLQSALIGRHMAHPTTTKCSRKDSSLL